MDQSSSDSMFELQIGYSTGNYFREASKWASFIAIVVFVVGGLIVLIMGAGVTYLLSMSPDPTYTGIYGYGGAAIAVGGIAILAYLFAAILLLRFASHMRRALNNQDQRLFNSSLKACKNYFMAMGILAILSFLYTILVFAFTIYRTAVPQSMF